VTRWASVEDLVAARDRGGAELEALNADPPEMAVVREGVVLRDGLTADVYEPKGEPPFPAYVYAHGGGWNRGSARGCRKRAMQIAEAGFVVVNLDYRLAPEHPFPAAVEDVVFALQWAALLGNGVAAGGDSAGANIVAAAAALLDEKPLALLLVNGIFDLEALPRGAGSDWELMLRAYLGREYRTLVRDPRASPLRADLERFPPSYVVCGELDPLLPQSQSFAAALPSATLRVVPGAGHGFNRLQAFFGEIERYRTWLASASGPSV
jgi:acetyl esterase